MTRPLFRALSTFAATLALATWLPSVAHAKTPLRIGYLPITDHLTIVAKAREESSTLDLQPVKFGSWPELAEALKAGAIDGAFALGPIGLTLRQKGVPIRAVLLGHRNGSVLTVRAGSDIKQPADLKGHTVAIPNRFSTHNILLHKLLAGAGLNADRDVKIIELAPPEMVNALSTGRIDAFIVAEPFGAQAELQKVGRVLILSKDIWPDHICCILNLRQDVIDRDPVAVQALVTSLVRTGHFITKDASAAARASKAFLGQKPEVIEHVLTKPRGRVTYERLVPELADLKATQDALVDYGIQKERVDLGAYLDDRFAKKAVAENP